MTNRQLASMAKTVLDVIKPEHDEEDVLILTTALRIAFNHGEFVGLKRNWKK